MQEKEKNQKRPRSTTASKAKPIQQNWPKGRDFRILSLDGGGIKGIYTASLLSRLEEKLPKGHRIADYFDLITGTSTGGIIALGFGAGVPAKTILAVYLDHGKEIFSKPFWKSGYLGAKYQRENLEKRLVEIFGEIKLGKSKSALCIPAVEGKFGEVNIFKTPHHPRFLLDKTRRMVDVGLATSAAPGYFKPFLKHGYFYVDGGLFANNPIMIGVVDALTNYKLDPTQIKVLSIACSDDKAPIKWRHKYFSGFFSWRDAMFISMDIQSQNVTGQTHLLVGPENLTRIFPDTGGVKIPLDNYKKAKNLLPEAAEKTFEEMGEKISKIFFQSKKAGCVFH